MTTLPESVRRRVVDLAADRLPLLDADEVPATLRQFVKFTPARRRQVVLPIAAALENDEVFRAAVAGAVRDGVPDLAAALEAGTPVPAADPEDVAAAAYLLRSPGWETHVERVNEAEAAAKAVAAEQAAALAEGRRGRDVDAEISALRARLASAEEQLRRATETADRERRRAREAADRARRAESALAEAAAAAESRVSATEAASAAATNEAQRLRERLHEAESALERTRRDTREARESADIRRWLLLDTLARSVAGLREELAPAPPTRRPADLVDAVDAAGPGAGSIATDDPAGVDALLSLPNAHLIVDGYNVTKTGYPDVTLEDQRSRLVAALAALAARTGAEVTCVFDGAEVQVRVPAAALRRVRVRFSPAGQSADELIRRLVRAEPAGRPVTVVTSDREVVDGVRRAGARTLTSRALLDRLDRA
ncbi:MAG TPA: NYN domain-containing protein [Mycobacteriales bacterium]|nr:NYN domain-containing protein [Mycobacteriales bacterium]